MLRPIAIASASAILVLSLAGCTAPQPQPSEPASTAPSAPTSDGGALPGCDAIAIAIGELGTGLSYDAASSATNTADEVYEQRVCVFVSSDSASRLGITIAAIPFLQTELDTYATLPGTVPDERLHGAVLQVFQPGDADDGQLDGPLYLFDTENSITVQAQGTALAQVTVSAAIDAAFAVREILG